MKRIQILFLLTLFAFTGHAQKYTVNIDLINVTDDKVNVTIQSPSLGKDSVEFHIPKIVPGTYSISDFGRFVSEFKAMDVDGNELQSSKLSENRWLIPMSSKLSKISFRVDDTFDSQLDNKVFEPGGTNIEAERNVFIINTFGFIGYFEGFDKLPYEVNVSHPESLYGATSLIPEKVSNTLDRFQADNYFNLADAPIMYSQPDTTSLEVGGAEILVSVFSPNKKLSSSQVMNEVKEILVAQKNYLGGTLPISKYAFLIYLFDSPSNSGSYGALEHSYSSLYFLPEAGADMLAQTVRDVAAHEFFHIVTPLNIHAEQIGNFNFIKPEMSEHLWLYEGVTEYAANHVQVKYDLISTEDFLSNMRDKMVSSARYNRDLAFTEMSKNVLDEYENQYGNVYQKGALIGMCLDLKLLYLSDGKYDLQQLMRDLSKEYGKQKSFKDEQLFDKIASLTYPEVGEFLSTYVGGNKRLPFTEVLNYAGVEFLEEKEVQTTTLGKIGIGLNEDQELYITNTSDMNDFGNSMGYLNGDVLLELNGEKVVLSTAQKMLDNYAKNTEPGSKVIVLVRREVKGKMKEVKLKGKAQAITTKEPYFLQLNEKPTDAQLKIRKAWLSAQ